MIIKGNYEISQQCFTFEDQNSFDNLYKTAQKQMERLSDNKLQNKHETIANSFGINAEYQAVN